MTVLTWYERAAQRLGAVAAGWIGAIFAVQKQEEGFPIYQYRTLQPAATAPDWSVLLREPCSCLVEQ